MASDEEASMADFVAFAIVNLNVTVDLEYFEGLSFTDPVYTALMKAWKDKQHRDDQRVGLLCAVIANCMGGGKKTYQPKDFMPKKPLTEDDIKANFQRVAALQKAQQMG